MKKILVVLLILAVAGGVFAQEGSWSIWGGVEVGTRLDLDPDPDIGNNKDDPATSEAWTYNDSYQTVRGSFGLGYSKDVLYVGLGWNGDNWNGSTEASASFWGDNFSAKLQFDNLFSALGNSNRDSISQLWGEYKFVDGMITLKAAYKGGWEGGDWMSDGTAAWVEGAGDYKNGLGFGGGGAFTLSDNWYAWGASEPFDPDTGEPNWNYHNFYIPDYAVEYYMPGNYLKAKAEIGAINFGIQIPYLFTFEKTELVNKSIKQSVFGVKFEQSPFEFAAQLHLANMGVYFGGKFFAGPITVGLSFMGILDGDGSGTDNDVDWQRMKFGGNVGYNGDGFGGGVLAFYQRHDTHDTTDFYESTVGIEPSFFYNAIPSYLQFKLNVGFYFFNFTDGNTASKGTTWGLQPEIHWNFLGTGAGDWGASKTGIAIRYRLSNADLRSYEGSKNTLNSENTLDFMFRWGF